MKPYVAGALLLQAAQAQLPDLGLLGGVLSPPVAVQTPGAPASAPGLLDFLADVIPPGTEDIILPEATESADASVDAPVSAAGVQTLPLPGLPSIALPSLGLPSLALPSLALPGISLPASSAPAPAIVIPPGPGPVKPVATPAPGLGNLFGLLPAASRSSSAVSSVRSPVAAKGPLGFGALDFDDGTSNITPAESDAGPEVSVAGDPSDVSSEATDSTVAVPDVVEPSTVGSTVELTASTPTPVAVVSSVVSTPASVASSAAPIPPLALPSLALPSLAIGNIVGGLVSGLPIPSIGGILAPKGPIISAILPAPAPRSSIIPLIKPVVPPGPKGSTVPSVAPGFSGGASTQDLQGIGPADLANDVSVFPVDSNGQPLAVNAAAPLAGAALPLGFDVQDDTQYDGENFGRGGRAPGLAPDALGDDDDPTQYDGEPSGRGGPGPRINADALDGDDDPTQYDGEDFGKGAHKSHGQKPTMGNGASGYEAEEECPSWCLEEDESSGTPSGRTSGEHSAGAPAAASSFPAGHSGAPAAASSSPAEHSGAHAAASSSPAEHAEAHAADSTSSAEHPTETHKKKKHKKKKTSKSSKSPHRIAVTVDDNVVYTSDYRRRDVLDDPAPSSGGFSGFQWPSKKTDDSQASKDQAPAQSSSASDAKNDKEISDQLQKGSHGQRAGHDGGAASGGGDGILGSTLPDWLNDLQQPSAAASGNGGSGSKPTGVSSAKPSASEGSGGKPSAASSAKPGGSESSGKPSAASGGKPSATEASGGKPSSAGESSSKESAQGKKKAKGKCPKSCKKKKGGKASGAPSAAAGKPSGSAPAGGASGKPSVEAAGGAKAAATSAPGAAAPTTLITIASGKKEEATATEAGGSKASQDTSKAGLPAGDVSSGDTFTGDTLAGVCPKQCNPFNPAENFCDHESSGCTTAGGSKYYCACRAGYKLSDSSDKDFSKQFKVPGQPYVYVYPGAKCDKQCGDGLCGEVLVRDQCV